MDFYWDRIVDWLDHKIPVARMLEMVRKNTNHPYQGGKSAFYDRVTLIRREVEKNKNIAIWRFEGLPREYLQVDWDMVPSKYLKGKDITCQCTFITAGKNEVYYPCL